MRTSLDIDGNHVEPEAFFIFCDSIYDLLGHQKYLIYNRLLLASQIYLI